MNKTRPLRLDVVSYAFSSVAQIVLSAYFGILSWRGVFPWETSFLSMGFLLIAIDHLMTCYWLHRFSVAPTAIFCALAGSFFFVFCIFSLRAGLLLVYLVAAAMTAVTFISFRSAIILDAYHRSIALLASGLLIYMHTKIAQNPLYLTLAASLLMYAFLLPPRGLNQRIHGVLVLLSTSLNVLSATGLFG